MREHALRRGRGRALLVGLVIALVTAACGNSKSQNQSATPLTTSKSPQTTATAQDLTKHLPRPGVKGVTGTTIRVAAITSTTNPIGGKDHQLIDGMKAYFKVVNDHGGIYGRKLVVVSDRDDQTGLQNTQQVTTSLADDNAFATFLATLQFTGADLLAKAKQPTFIWNINPEFANSPTSDHSNIFASYGALCYKCSSPVLPWVAEQNNFTKVGVLAYGVSAESKLCAAGDRAAFTKYSEGKTKVAFFDDTIPFAGDLTADVANMKDAGVQLVTTCMDANEVLKLQREMKKQNLDAVQWMSNSYDHDVLKTSGTLFDGSFVMPEFYVPEESQPQSPATKAYLDNIGAVTNDPVEITEIGWILAEEFVDGLKGAGPEFTQQKVIDWLNGQTAYTAGGLVQPINWTTGHIDPQTHPEVIPKVVCVTVLQVSNGTFVPYQNHPGKPWTCLDDTQPAGQSAVYKSFAPGGAG